ncbi:MAG: phosphatidate cytidylyltransferase [Thermodesulfobacteriota bacterium]
MTRLVTAGLLIPLFYWYVTRLPVVYFKLLVTALGGVGLAEFFFMTSLKGYLRSAAVLGGVVLLWFVSDRGSFSFHPVLALTAGLLLIRLFAPRNPEGAVRDVGVACSGLLYICGLLSYQVLLRSRGSEYIVLLYAVVWSCDGLALYAGRFFGRHKLYPAMSPNKTLEGAVGGLLGGVLAAGVVNYFFEISSYSVVMLLGAAASAVGQAGDLVESMLKRDAGVKDSSALFPGHGGVLDKIDAALFAGPVLYFGFRLFQV